VDLGLWKVDYFGWLKLREVIGQTRIKYLEFIYLWKIIILEILLEVDFEFVFIYYYFKLYVKVDLFFGLFLQFIFKIQDFVFKDILVSKSIHFNLVDLKYFLFSYLKNFFPFGFILLFFFF
jgi:hypothetical protein